MKLLEILRIAYNNLRSNRMRSLLTIVGISVGISTIVFLLSLGYGLQQLSIKKIASIEAINTLDVTSGKTAIRRVDSELAEELKANSKVEKVSPLLSLGFKVDWSGKKTDAVGNFVDDDFASLEGLEVKYGGFFANSPSDIVVSSALLKALDVEPSEAVNKEIPATLLVARGAERLELERTYKVIGIIQDDASSYVFAPIASVAEAIGGEVVYNAAKVKIKNQDDIQFMRGEIEKMGFTTTSIADTIDQVDQIFRIIQIVLAFFGLVALLVASIGMFNTMTVALLERTRDIGIMKSLGVRDKDVSKMFLLESAIISSLGGTIGVVGGYIVSALVNFGVNQLAQSVGGEPQTIFYTPPLFALGIIIFSVFVGLGTGFYPSRRASRLNPLDALRYE